MNNESSFIQWFRNASPYINAHRGKTFVLMLPGQCFESDKFHHLVSDIALLNSLGIRLVIVHGARPQIDEQLAHSNITSSFHNGVRITESAHIADVCEAVGSLRFSIEAALSAGLPNSPMQGAHIKVISGNFVTAKPAGVIDGVDYHHTGKVRRIDSYAINHTLEKGAVVLVSNLGFSLTGEVFNLSYTEVATRIASALNADKLIAFSDTLGITEQGGDLRRELSLIDCREAIDNTHDGDICKTSLQACYEACSQGVPRAHIISYLEDGSLLSELFSRDGAGTMVYNDHYETLRDATIEDVGGILELLEPLETQGTLVRRSRELLENEISQFKVVEKDGTIIACAALYPFDGDMAEIACVATRSDYRNQGRGRVLLKQIESQAKKANIKTLFILTTQTAHWFMENGFVEGSPSQLPQDKQQLYNYQRRSKVFVKAIG
ncbi:amino-acid N-acetyltransferase [Aurantivibrio plasticivorans]